MTLQEKIESYRSTIQMWGIRYRDRDASLSLEFLVYSGRWTCCVRSGDEKVSLYGNVENTPELAIDSLIRNLTERMR